MKYGRLEDFEMHRTKEAYGISSDRDSVKLLEKEVLLDFHDVQLEVDHDFGQDSFWTGFKAVLQA